MSEVEQVTVFARSICPAPKLRRKRKTRPAVPAVQSLKIDRALRQATAYSITRTWIP